jgi:hypothetical protein
MLRKVFYQAAASHPSEGQQLSLVGGFLKYSPLLPLAPGAGERIASGSGLGATASSSGAFPCLPLVLLLGLSCLLGLTDKPNGHPTETCFNKETALGNALEEVTSPTTSGQKIALRWRS